MLKKYHILFVFISSLIFSNNSFSLDLDGVDDYLNIPSNDLFNEIESEMTLSIWINPSEYSSDIHPKIFMRTEGYGGGPDRWFLDWSPQHLGNVVNFSGRSAVYGNTSIEINTWTHIAVTFDGGDVKHLR